MPKLFHSKKYHSDRRGFIMIVMYLLLIVFTGISLSLMVKGIAKKQVARKYQANTIAYQNAHSGIDVAIANLITDMANSSSWSDGSINGSSMGPNTAAYYTAYGPSTINSGTYTVSFKNVASSTKQIWIKSVGTYGGVTRTIETYVKYSTPSLWDNAIFAGRGTPGSLVNGNVNVAGSVTLIGTNLSSSDYALDLGGTATLVSNNYSGLTAGQRALIPTLPTTTVGGETVETLNGILRVQHGKVGLSGSAEVGQANETGNTYKETVDGVYSNDGFGGTGGTANVHSDNGYSNPWDLGTLSFPSLSSAYGGYASYSAYMQATGYTLTAAQVTALSNIRPTSSFSYGDANGSISMDGSGNMTISGKLYMNGGDLGFNKAGSNKTITYSGSGVIYVSGTVNVNTSLVPANNGASPAAFPGNAIAIVTPGNMTFNEAGITDYGLFYAENTLTIQKQTTVIGSVVAQNLNMGINVPSIYAVHDLPNYLPLGTPDLTSTSVMSVVVWLET